MHKIEIVKGNVIKEEIIISNLNLQNKKSIKEIDVKKKEIILNELIPIEENDREFDLLMSIYQHASNQVLEMLNGVQKEYSSIFNKNIINHTTSRIKTPKSIINKMKKKNLELNYNNLVENINDIAGVRVICPLKDDIYKIVSIIEKVPNWNLILEKDYIKNPKKSGYSGYHMIVEVPVNIEQFNEKRQIMSEGSNNRLIEESTARDELTTKWKLKNQIFVKVEIQIRTMAMDFWATNEHKMKYKTNKKLSFWDSERLKIYAKVINIIDNRISKISNRQTV